mmetsp:Transcript_14317/g.35427  ORF Transcript_14317/g.35427 Transcript_14317/m.35427 type:complete len:201 (+) Transcript_14317:73-675(+)
MSSTPVIIRLSHELSAAGGADGDTLHWIMFKFRNRHQPAFADEYLDVLEATGMRRTLLGVYHVGVHINEHWLGIRWHAGREHVLEFEEEMRTELSDAERTDARALLDELLKRVGNEDLRAVLDDDDDLLANFTLFFTLVAVSNALARFDLTKKRTPKASVLKELLGSPPELLTKMLKGFLRGPDFWDLSSLFLDDDAHTE